MLLPGLGEATFDFGSRHVVAIADSGSFRWAFREPDVVRKSITAPLIIWCKFNGALQPGPSVLYITVVIDGNPRVQPKFGVKWIAIHKCELALHRSYVFTVRF